MTHSKPRERDSFRDFRDTGYLSKNPRDIYVGHCSVNLLEYWISSTDVRGYRVGKLLRETERLGQKLTGYWKSDFALIGPPKCSFPSNTIREATVGYISVNTPTHSWKKEFALF